MREIIPLNFDWSFGIFKENHLKETSNDLFEQVNLPHHAVTIPFNNFDEHMLEGVFTYIKKIDIKKEWTEKIICLRFEGVAHSASIYFNKILIETHQGGYTPFEIDLSKYITSDDEVEIMVIVDSHENDQIPPFGGVVDYLGYAGIYREVSLIVLEKHHLKDTFIHTDGKKIVRIESEASMPQGILIYKIKDQQQVVVSKGMIVIEKTHIQTETIVQNATLWSIENPYLYTIDLHYEVESKLVDSLSIRFGFRHAEFREDGFYLNGKYMKLLGLNRHQSYPYVGYAMPKSMQEYDADILKFRLGVNIVRTSHYPQSMHFLNRADEIGLLVFEEIPGWQHIGDLSWQQQSLSDLKDMILRDRNHPSIILWGVRINESPDHHAFFKNTNELAKKLDPTRQTGGVRNIQFSEFLEDVYTYNDFSHTGLNKGLDDKKKVCKRVPYLVTEYNGHMFPTKRYDTESKRIEHALRHLRVIDAMMEKDNQISGAIGWCMNDYNTHQEFGSGDKVCYHGVLDMFRIDKYASYAYQSQQSKTPFMEVLSTMNIGEYPGGQLPEIYVLTNLDYVNLYQNETFIDTIYPDKKAYPNLIHPPVIIKDFIGESLAVNEKMKPKDAEKAKEVFKAITKYGNRLPLRYKLKMLFLLKKYKLTLEQGVAMFYKYTTGWGSEKRIYRFEGYKDEKLVKTIYKENTLSYTYLVEQSKEELNIEETYDVIAFTIKKVNQHHEILHYAQDACQIEVTGAIELIGPKIISLQGGAIGFYIRSKEQGVGHIKIMFNDQIIEKEVKVNDRRS
jgi:beta-galactosidase